MGHDVFVSHSSKDKTTADAVCAILESQGIRCWVAPRDILPGQNWGASIVQAITNARVMVLIFSHHANTSQHIYREVERAVHRGIPIIPVRIEQVMPTESLEYFLSSPHWLDAFTPPLEQHLDYLAKIVKRIIDLKPPLPEARPETTPTSSPHVSGKDQNKQESSQEVTGDEEANVPARKSTHTGVIAALAVLVLAVVIFGLVNHQRAKQAERDRIAAAARDQLNKRNIRIKEMDQILEYCRRYELDFNSQWPDSLSQLHPSGALSEITDQYLYKKPGPNDQSTAPATTKVLFEKTPLNANEEVVGFLDGHVQVFTIAVDRAEPYYLRGVEKSDAKDLEGAIADYSKSIELNPKKVDAYEMRAMAERRKGDSAAALADCLKAIEIDPAYDLAYFMRGVLEYDKNEFDAALADFNKSIELKPDFGRAYYLRARTKSAKGDVSGAIVDYKKALDLNPGDSEAKAQLDTLTK